MQGSATTSLDVLNLALSTLGKDHCDSFDPKLGIEPESLEGKKVARLFNKAIDDVQREFYWHELITAKAVIADSVKSHDGRYRYPLPDDCIRPLGVRLPSDSETLIPTAYTRLVAQDSEYDYDVEGNFLLTGAASLTPQPDAMVVEGSGVSVGDGTYLRDENQFGREAFSFLDSIFIQWDGMEFWQISDKVANTVYYYLDDNSLTIDEAIAGNPLWSSYDLGYLPVPTVRRATWADIDAAGIYRSAVPLLAEVFEAEIVYLRRAASPADWTSELLDCIVAKLAADAALSVTGEYRLTQALKADYRMTIRSEAKRLQSKYKTNETRMPRGFGAWRANRG